MSRAQTKLAAIRVGWSDPTELLNVDKSAASELVPFLELADGGGGHEVVALDFRDFLARLGKPTSAFRELIEPMGSLGG